jgi:hypothetical protein
MPCSIIQRDFLIAENYVTIIPTKVVFPAFQFLPNQQYID